jgi:hypothetical protein
MRRLSRWVLVAVAAALVMPSSRAADVSNVLPAETEQVMYMNFRQIFDSDIMKKYALGQFKQALKAGDAQKMLEEIGLNPLTDLDKVTVGLWGKDPQNMNAVAVMTGKFDADKLIKAAENAAKDMGDKLTIETEGDFKLVKIAGDQGKPFYISVANEKTIVGGTEKKLVVAGRTAIDKNAKPVLNKDVSALVLKQDDKASMWFCGMTEGKLGEVDIPEIPGVDAKSLKTSLGKMVSAGMTIRLGEDVNLNITMNMKDADAADEFNVTVGKLLDLAKTFLPLAAMNAPQAEALIKDVVNTIKSDSKDKEVTIKLKLTAEAIGKASGAGKD